MLMTAREKLINDLASMSNFDYDALLEDVEQERMERKETTRREALAATRREALAAFENAWEKLEDLGLCAYCGCGDRELPISYIVWKE